jgi:hypothetical protein
LLLAPECYGCPASRACPDLADQRGGCRPLFPWGRGRSGGRGSCGLAYPGDLEKACDHLHVSYIPVVFKILLFLKYFFYIKIFVSLQGRSCCWGCGHGERRRDCGGGRGRPFRWRWRRCECHYRSLRHRLRFWRWGRFWRALRDSASAQPHRNAS